MTLDPDDSAAPTVGPGAGWASLNAQPISAVGEFRQGTPTSQWALTRYLVGRAVAESLGAALLLVGLLVLAAGALLWWRGWLGAGAVLVLVALFLLLMRAALVGLLRRLTAAPGGDPRLRALVRQTRRDVLRELRRVGLPGRTPTLPLLVSRLARPRTRARTLERLREFDTARAVPPARLDELHMLLRTGR